MTAEFNINLPGADILKRLTNLETDVGILMATSASKDRSIGDLRGLVTALEQRVEKLEDGAGWTDGANMENATAPVDTSWHPYDVAANTPGFQAPWGRDRRVVVMTRYDNIEGPAKADTFDWGECGGGTIVAWRYAKAGE